MAADDQPRVEVTIAYENGEADIYLCEDFKITGQTSDWVGAEVRESSSSIVGLHIERRGLNYIRKRTTTPKPQGLPS